MRFPFFVLQIKVYIKIEVYIGWIMFKARLFVVDEKTLENTFRTEIVSVKTPAPTGTMWEKTVADIMADMLQIEIGDYIFLWRIKDGNRKSQIYGVLRAISVPYYQMDNNKDEYPFKIKVERAYNFANPIDEYDVLNSPYIKGPLWTIVGKKIAGKSRGSSPLSMEEIQYLITLLIEKNKDYRFQPFSKNRTKRVRNGLRVSYKKKGENSSIRTLSKLNPNKLCYFNTDGSLKYEKVLETVFNQEMAAKNNRFFSQLGINVKKVVWFSNYLPYSIEQSEMDYLVMESDDGQTISRYFLIEFMKDVVDEDHIYRCLQYSKWISDTLTLGTQNVQPLLICGKVKRDNDEITKFIGENEEAFGTRKMKIFTYNFKGTEPSFEQMR